MPPASCSPPPNYSCPSTPRWDDERCRAALTAATYTRDHAPDEVLAFAADLVETPVVLEDSCPRLQTVSCLASCTACRGEPPHAVPLLRAAIDHLRNPETLDGIRMSVPINVVSLAEAELMDDNAPVDVINADVRFARRTGALRVLAPALTALAAVLTFQGRLDDAQAAGEEGRALGQATGTPGLPGRQSSFVELALLCWRGHEVEARVPLGQNDIRRGARPGRCSHPHRPATAVAWRCLSSASVATDRPTTTSYPSSETTGSGSQRSLSPMSSRPQPAAANWRRPAKPWPACKNGPKQAGRRGGSGGSPAAWRYWAKTPPSPSTASQSISWSQPLRSPIWPGPTCSTGSGCAAGVAGRTARLHLGAAYDMFGEMGANGFASRA